MRYTYKDIEVMATALIMQQETDFEPSEATFLRYYMDLLRIFAAANEPLLSKEQ